MSYTFKTVTQASQFLAKEKGVDLLSARDCIYKAMRKPVKQTHGFNICRNELGVTLTEIEKK